MINIKKFTFNPVGVNAYLLWDETREAVLIDPAFFYHEEQATLTRFVEKEELTIVQLLNTHGHFDHLMGNNFAEERWNLKCRIHPGDLPLAGQSKHQASFFGITMPNPTIPVSLHPGEVITFGHTSMGFIHVPGHSAGSVAYYAEQDQLLVVGDILFEGSVGRTDLPGGNHAQLISGIREKLLTLPDETSVCSGHGNDTTIGRERYTNPFLQ